MKHYETACIWKHYETACNYMRNAYETLWDCMQLYEKCMWNTMRLHATIWEMHMKYNETACNYMRNAYETLWDCMQLYEKCTWNTMRLHAIIWEMHVKHYETACNYMRKYKLNEIPTSHSISRTVCAYLLYVIAHSLQEIKKRMQGVYPVIPLIQDSCIAFTELFAGKNIPLTWSFLLKLTITNIPVWTSVSLMLSQQGLIYKYLIDSLGIRWRGCELIGYFNSIKRQSLAIKLVIAHIWNLKIYIYIYIYVCVYIYIYIYILQCRYKMVIVVVISRYLYMTILSVSVVTTGYDREIQISFLIAIALNTF